jgi:imidazolonepropionase-like amidohydrolase
MRKRTFIRVAAFWLPIVALNIGSVVVAQSGLASNRLALVGATIYANPTDEPIYDGAIIIQDGKIEWVGRGPVATTAATVQTIDASGLTVTAGFWNSHVHFLERKWADAGSIPAPELERQVEDMVTRYGFTSVFDIGSNWANTRHLRDRIDTGELRGPRIRSTGEALVAAGAGAPDIVLKSLGFLTSTTVVIANAARATSASTALLNAGVDGIKVHLQPPGPPNLPVADSAIKAVVNEAHRAGKPVFVHPATAADVKRSVRSGVDVIAHTTPASGSWDEMTLAAMKKGRVALTPTLSIWKYLLRHDRASAQEQSVRAYVAQLRSWVPPNSRGAHDSAR